MAKTIGELKRKAQAEGAESLTAAELRQLRDAEKTAREMAEAARRRKPKATPAPADKPAGKRKRRISRRYQGKLDEIAEIHVACGEGVAETVQRVRDDMGEPLCETTLRGWIKRSPDWQAAVENARIVAANRKQAQPELRSPRSIADLQSLRQTLRNAYDGENGDAKTLRLILDCDKAIRDEERHIADLRVREAKRSFRRFLRALAAFAKTRFPNYWPAVGKVLQAAALQIEAIMDARDLKGVSE